VLAAAAALAGCSGGDPLPAAYERCVQQTIEHAVAANQRPVPRDLQQQFEAMQRQLAESACAQQRQACEKNSGSAACQAFLSRYAR
jgi:hypothetical protein